MGRMSTDLLKCQFLVCKLLCQSVFCWTFRVQDTTECRARDGVLRQNTSPDAAHMFYPVAHSVVRLFHMFTFSSSTCLVSRLDGSSQHVSLCSSNAHALSQGPPRLKMSCTCWSSFSLKSLHCLMTHRKLPGLLANPHRFLTVLELELGANCADPRTGSSCGSKIFIGPS